MIQSDPHGNMRKCGQPYPQLGVADGISFSCGNTGKLQPSLKFIFEEIERTVYQGYPTHQDVDLKRWSEQGILMLNTALTVEVGNIGSHYDIWKPFTAYLLDWLNSYNPGLVYVYMGKKAEEWSQLTNDNNHKITVKHPASAAYNGSKWDSNDLFNRVSEIVKSTSGDKIIWQNDRYIYKVDPGRINTQYLLCFTLYKRENCSL